jgi:uncharacterized protein YueI
MDVLDNNGAHKYLGDWTERVIVCVQSLSQGAVQQALVQLDV